MTPRTWATALLEPGASGERRGQLAGLAAAVLFGCTAPLITTLDTGGSALAVAGLLYAGAALALGVLNLIRSTGRDEAPLTRADGPALAGITLLGGVVGPVALVLGLARLPAASSSLLLNLEAVFTLAIAVLLGREHLGRRGALAAGLTIAGALVLSEGTVTSGSWHGGLLIALATLAWAIDNNLSQRLSLRDPIQVSGFKAAGAALPMLAVALLLGEPFPPRSAGLVLLVIGALGYGLSIWLDLLALRHLGAAREAVIFSTAPFVGALFALLILREPLTRPLAAAGLLMASGLVLLLRDRHSHWHRHAPLRHAHRHRHDPRHPDPHHEHAHAAADVQGHDVDAPFWHAHDHQHDALAHAHPHVSDAHHRHGHGSRQEPPEAMG